MHCDWINHQSSPTDSAVQIAPNHRHIWKIIINKWPVLNTTFTWQWCLSISHICFLGTDWFLSMKWSFSEAWSGRCQRKLAGSRFKTSYRKSYRASYSKMWPIWNVCMVSWGDCAFSWQTNALKINKPVESTLGPGNPVPLMAGVWESTWWRYHFICFC